VSTEENHRLFLAKTQIRSRGRQRQWCDVCNVVAFFEGWDRVDVQDDTGNGEPRASNVSLPK